MVDEKQRRKLRSRDETPSVNSSKLYNFDNPNDILYQDQPILLDYTPQSSDLPKYSYYKEKCEMPQLPKRETSVTTEPSALSRRRTHKTDPLRDDLYMTFHRRMMKDERSSTTADKSRIMFEMDNLRNQYELLKQHDWKKHLPSVTRVNDRSDYEELQQKRKLTLAEIRKTFAKFSSWEARNLALASEIKQFESGSLKESRDADRDDDESILDISPEQILRKRRRERAQKDGFCFRLRLGNGLDIVSNPYSVQRVSIQASIPLHAGLKRRNR